MIKVQILAQLPNKEKVTHCYSYIWKNRDHEDGEEEALEKLQKA